MPYAYQPKKENAPRIARARISGVNASYKDLCEVCRNVRGKDTDYALGFLERAAEGEQAIYFARHCKRKGHRRELGGKKGGFPVKSVKFVLTVLQGAAANASKLGLGATKVAHIIANKQDTYPRMSPKGRRIRHDYETAFIEIVLEESQEKSGSKKEEKKAKPAPMPKQATPAPKAQPATAQTAKPAPTEAKRPEEKRAEQKMPDTKQKSSSQIEKQIPQKQHSTI